MYVQDWQTAHPQIWEGLLQTMFDFRYLRATLVVQTPPAGIASSRCELRRVVRCLSDTYMTRMEMKGIGNCFTDSQTLVQARDLAVAALMARVSYVLTPLERI